MLDLRSFLGENTGDVMRVADPIAVRHEITALQYALWEGDSHPVILAEKPLLDDGRVSGFRAVTNLTASRALTAKILGVSEHRNAARELASRTEHLIAPLRVASADASCKQVIRSGDLANLNDFPVFTQHEADAGPYLTAAHATTYDPETGIDNTAIQRVWVKSDRRFGYYPYLASHNRRNILKFWERGEAAPVAFWIGHHPAVSIGTQAKLGYPESHWATAGGVAGEAIRLVPTELFGDSIMVPAEAEIVLEGFVPPHVVEPEGGFGEYTGFSSGETMSPVFDLKVVTHRGDAIYHDYASGLPDSLVPDNMMIEAKLFAIARGVSDAVRQVHVPVSGRRFHAYLSVGDVSPETVRAMLLAVLEFRRVKHVVIVNDDIDIFDETQLLWAVATRTQMSRDALVLDDIEGSALDPSLADGMSRTAKLGIDATWRNSRHTRNTVPKDLLEAARRRIG